MLNKRNLPHDNKDMIAYAAGLFDGEGNNVSASSDFFVDDIKIASNTHTFNSTGTYNVYANYGQLTSENSYDRLRVHKKFLRYS